MSCPDEKLLSAYLDEEIPDVERKRIEEHVSRCNDCLDLLLVAYESQKGRKDCPPFIRKKVKERLGLKAGTRRSAMKWLLLSIFFFVLSFIIKRYFLQLLVAASITGFKWVMEGEGAKKVVMIFKGIQKDEKDFERKPPPGVSVERGGGRYGEEQ